MSILLSRVLSKIIWKKTCSQSREAKAVILRSTVRGAARAKWATRLERKRLRPYEVKKRTFLESLPLKAPGDLDECTCSRSMNLKTEIFPRLREAWKRGNPRSSIWSPNPTLISILLVKHNIISKKKIWFRRWAHNAVWIPVDFARKVSTLH